MLCHVHDAGRVVHCLQLNWYVPLLLSAAYVPVQMYAVNQNAAVYLEIDAITCAMTSAFGPTV